jgi:hypothetical protein
MRQRGSEMTPGLSPQQINVEVLKKWVKTVLGLLRVFSVSALELKNCPRQGSNCKRLVHLSAETHRIWQSRRVEKLESNG